MKIMVMLGISLALAVALVWPMGPVGDGGQNDMPMPLKILEQINKGGGTVYLKGVIKGLKLEKLKFPDNNPLVIDGQGETIVYGFHGDPVEFDPANQPVRSWGNLTITDCHNVIVRNLEVWGGIEQAVSLNDSYPEVGLRNIHLVNVTVRYAQTRGVFLGGSNVNGIVLDGVRVYETIYDGSSTHGIYISGGVWNSEYGPVSDIVIRKTTVGLTGGRHGIQLNGRIEGVIIDSCDLWHNELYGISLIGVRDCTISNCRMWGQNRGGIVIYDYWDEAYWDPKDPKAVDQWRETHHACGDIVARNNTICVGPTRWKTDQWHNNNPVEHPAILINNDAHGYDTVKGKMYFPQGPIEFKKNIVLSPNPVLLDIRKEQSAKVTYPHDNILYCTGGSDALAITPLFSGTFKLLKEQYGLRNYFMNPAITVPVYPCINLTESPNYNWKPWIKMSEGITLFSSVGKKWGIGASAPPIAVRPVDAVPVLVPVNDKVKILSPEEYPPFLKELNEKYKDQNRGG